MAEYIKVPAGVYDMVTRCMEQEFPDHVAIRYVAEDSKTVVEKKYREYAQDIRRMVAYLKAEVPDIKGRRIVLLSRNCYEFCVASYGIILAGGVLVTLNQKKTWEELEYELGLVEPALILNDGIDYGCRAELEAAYGPKLRPMDCYKDTAPGELTNCVGHDDLMMLMFTSGTTGRSKGVMLSERNMCASLHTYSEVAENWITNRLPAGQKLPLSHMTLLPLFHMACFVCVMSYPPAGWALNLCGDIRDFYRDLGLMHSDVMASAPMLVETIYNDMKRGRVSRLNGLWDLCCSSAALDPKMLLELAQNGFVVNQCYGMTETFGDGILNFTQVEKHMSAVGKPDDHVQYKLDETGEICIKGDCVMLGYYKDPEATEEVIDADGWFHTGDLARMDEEGFYYITGRKKNLIILASGENVSPEELEKKLALCPAITECIVKEKGQKICAVIYCPEDKQEEVRAFVTEVNRSLTLYKRISAVEFTVEPLPRNALGKLLRK
ncbi:AMP-binding protein [Faecalibacterium prausnitzii]|uniref:Acyl-CoA synthetase n=1 Tax=Faecalibacterium prausnitzii TaxID=853 RepID=A0AAX1QHP5_9FIRM|nr:class I adenylate-forming enzyme family protein [Faecalibacterium prausnitzii]AXA82479.1 acyl-CoA synthetase [Faecalibacterium prausnitzii]RAW49715.1 acyl-CoA synthetase [Faecalibacterium prausnitzii]